MKKFGSIFILIVVIIGTLSITANAYWSDSYQISYQANKSTYTMDEGIAAVPKISEDAYAEFQGAYITSWSRPSARLVNSEKEGRSGWVKLKEDAIYATYDVTATINYYYYAEVEGAWNQLFTDTMRFRYNPF
jgi:hypothetical protein